MTENDQWELLSGCIPTDTCDMLGNFYRDNYLNAGTTTVQMIKYECWGGKKKKMVISNCYDCPKIHKDNYVCDYFSVASNRWTAGGLPTTSSPQALACCPKGDTSPACTASETNHCSPSYSDPKVKDAPWYAWYSYCAGISDQSCGGNQELVARKNETKIF